MVSEIDLTEGIREFAVERLGVDLFGVAPVRRLEGGPEGDALQITCLMLCL